MELMNDDKGRKVASLQTDISAVAAHSSQLPFVLEIGQDITQSTYLLRQIMGKNWETPGTSNYCGSLVWKVREKC
jgi:hypothetical protein